MNIDRVLKSRSNRKERQERPFSIFYQSFTECKKAGDSILNDSVPEFKSLLERSIIITMVTAIEVYFKDVLDGIFRYCTPDFFELHLKKIHSTKYDINDLLLMYKKQIHPLELISDNQSFQNTDTIEAVFSKFLGKSLWGAVMEMEVRVADEHEKNGNFSHKDLDALKSLFSLRHELVHNPSNRFTLTKQVMENAIHASWLIFGVNIVLMQMMSDNKDPDLGNE